MRRVFFHVDEFGERGMVNLPYLTCLSDPLVVWAPSALLLQKTAGTFLKPAELLSLIDQPNAPVRIIGRREWLLDKEFRNSRPWPLAHWVEEFDGVVKKFADEDEKKSLSRLERRVIIAEPEKGYDKADEVLNCPEGENVAKRLRQLFDSGCLPIGILEKARRAEADNSSVPREILRDVYNHSRAMDSADAEVAATPCEHMAILQKIVPDSVVTRDTTLQPPGQGYVTAADIRDAVQVLSKVKPVMNMRELSDFLKSGLKKDLHHLMYSPTYELPLGTRLVKEIIEATAVPPLFKDLFQPNDPYTLVLRVVDLMDTIAARSIMMGSLAGSLISVLAEAAQEQLRKYGLVREAVRPGHPVRALFFFIFGTEEPVRSQVDQLQHLLSLLESVGDL